MIAGKFCLLFSAAEAVIDGFTEGPLSRIHELRGLVLSGTPMLAVT